MKNIKTLYTIIIALLLVLGFNFATAKGHLQLNQGMLERFETNKVAGALLINKKGDIVLVDRNGNPGKPCSFADQKGKIKTCRGFNGGKVLGLTSIPILQTKGSICFATTSSDGHAIQICI